MISVATQKVAIGPTSFHAAAGKMPTNANCEKLMDPCSRIGDQRMAADKLKQASAYDSTLCNGDRLHHRASPVLRHS